MRLSLMPDGTLEEAFVAKQNLGESATSEELQIEETRLLAEWNAQEYARNRRREYNRLNQFELISDDDVNGTSTHKDAVAAVKTKWPKDNSGPVE